MILFHASSDGKNKEILQEVRITQMNLGDILINWALRGLIFPDGRERIIPSHVTLEWRSQPDVWEGVVDWAVPLQPSQGLLVNRVNTEQWEGGEI